MGVVYYLPRKNNTDTEARKIEIRIISPAGEGGWRAKENGGAPRSPTPPPAYQHQGCLRCSSHRCSGQKLVDFHPVETGVARDRQRRVSSRVPDSNNEEEGNNCRESNRMAQPPQRPALSRPTSPPLSVSPPPGQPLVVGGSSVQSLQQQAQQLQAAAAASAASSSSAAPMMRRADAPTRRATTACDGDNMAAALGRAEGTRKVRGKEGGREAAD